MKKILLIRRNQRDNYVWKEVLSRLPASVCDVCVPSQLEVLTISSDREVSVRFSGLPLSHFDHVFFLGVPWPPAMEDDAQFAWSEWDASLIAAFRISKAPVFNRGLSLAYNKMLQNPIPFCKYWEKAGWKVPQLSYFVGEGGFGRRLEPNPGSGTSYLLYITPLDYFLWPGYKIIFPDHDKFTNLIAATRKEMSLAGYDFLVFRMFVSGGDFYLFGHVGELPHINDNAKLISLIRELLL